MHKVPQLHHFIKQLLQVVVGNLAFKRRNKRLCFLGSVRAETSFESRSVNVDGLQNSSKLTELAALKALKLGASCEQLLYGRDMFLLLESCKQLEVFLGLEQSLGLGDLLLDVAPARRHGVDDGARFRQVQGRYLLELSQTQRCRGLFVSGRGSLWARDGWRCGSGRAGVGHVDGDDWRREDEADGDERQGVRIGLADNKNMRSIDTMLPVVDPKFLARRRGLASMARASFFSSVAFTKPSHIPHFNIFNRYVVVCGVMTMSTSLSTIPMGIQFMSDLHLERTNYNHDISQAASHLALVGDIGRFSDFDGYVAFLEKQCQQFDKVFLIAGNNEFYGSSHREGVDAAQRLIDMPSLRGKLAFLNRNRFDLTGSIIVLGCTLHSHIEPEHTQLNKDFERIKEWTITDHNEEHGLDLKWLQASLQQIADTEPDKRVIILTHYAPSFQNTCHPMHENNAVSQCFCSDTLEAFKGWRGSEQVTNWIFGHTHWNTRFKFGNTVVQSNCMQNQPRNLSWWRRLMIYRPFDERAVVDSSPGRSWSDWLFRT